MRTDITFKIPEGKLVRMTLEYDTTILHHAKICGDFFIHPEETILEIESSLRCLPVESSEARIKHILDQVVERNSVQLIGIDTQNLAKLIHGAIYQ